MVEGKTNDETETDTAMKNETLKETTRKMWVEAYLNEQYEIPKQNYNGIERDIKYEQTSSYNLMVAAERQREFYYNVSLPHYPNKFFLIEAIDRYHLDDLIKFANMLIRFT